MILAFLFEYCGRCCTYRRKARAIMHVVNPRADISQRALGESWIAIGYGLWRGNATCTRIAS